MSAVDIDDSVVITAGSTVDVLRIDGSFAIVEDSASPYVRMDGQHVFKFAVKAMSVTANPHAIPNLTLTRGARRLRFFQGRRALVVMRGEIQHKNLWLIDLETAWCDASGFEIAAVAFSAAILSFIALDGRSNWFEGVLLLASYVIMAISFFFL